MADNTVVLMGVRDVGPIHEPLDKYSTLTKDTLARADLRFAQVERVYSKRGALQVHSGGGHSRVIRALLQFSGTAASTWYRWRATTPWTGARTRFSTP